MEQQLKLQDVDIDSTILGQVHKAVDPETGEKFTAHQILPHADEFMYCPLLLVSF